MRLQNVIIQRMNDEEFISRNFLDCSLSLFINNFLPLLDPAVRLQNVIIQRMNDEEFIRRNFLD